MANEFLYWHELRGKPIKIANQGREAGIIEDFYYEPETQSINSLRVHASLYGYRILLPSAISALDRSGVTIANENLLIPEDNAGPIYQLPLGDRLIGFNVHTERGQELGVVRQILLGISPPVALRIAALDLDGTRHLRISAHEITHFEDGALSIIEAAGRKFR